MVSTVHVAEPSPPSTPEPPQSLVLETEGEESRDSESDANPIAAAANWGEVPESDSSDSASDYNARERGIEEQGIELVEQILGRRSDRIALQPTITYHEPPVIDLVGGDDSDSSGEEQPAASRPPAASSHARIAASVRAEDYNPFAA